MIEFILATYEDNKIVISTTDNWPVSDKETAYIREELLSKRDEGLVAVLRRRSE